MEEAVMSVNEMGSLLDDMMEDFARLTLAEEISDGMGGRAQAWAEGETFRAFLREDRAGESAEAQRMAEAPKFTLVTPWAVELGYHEIVKRLSDGTTYRMLSDTRNKRPPVLSAIHIAAASCERWEIE